VYFILDKHTQEVIFEDLTHSIAGVENGDMPLQDVG
jgi:hypothetical protein